MLPHLMLVDSRTYYPGSPALRTIRRSLSVCWGLSEEKTCFRCRSQVCWGLGGGSSMSMALPWLMEKLLWRKWLAEELALR